MRSSSFCALLLASSLVLDFTLAECPADADSRVTECQATIDGLDKTDSSIENCKKLRKMQMCIDELTDACWGNTEVKFIDGLWTRDNSGAPLGKKCPMNITDS